MEIMYCRKSLGAGDYRGENREALFRGMASNMRRVVTDEERNHAWDQIADGLAVRALTSAQGDELYALIGCTGDGGF